MKFSSNRDFYSRIILYQIILFRKMDAKLFDFIYLCC